MLVSAFTCNAPTHITHIHLSSQADSLLSVMCSLALSVWPWVNHDPPLSLEPLDSIVKVEEIPVKFFVCWQYQRKINSCFDFSSLFCIRAEGYADLCVQIKVDLDCSEEGAVTMVSVRGGAACLHSAWTSHPLLEHLHAHPSDGRQTNK